ncbi:MAG: N-acetylmuramic acid 6-phosphate etherase, partial [Candidatus Obscuribacterales bacterium]|nr:N-acetylmuramic acid 6-phosphate etherase [Candidatus Obscuribacterales bacterium]
TAFKSLITEERNARTMHLDTLNTEDLVRTVQEEDIEVAKSVAAVVPDIAKAVDLAAECLARGGRMVYFGAGTSGRLGVLDATECTPTFGVEPHMVQAWIAGGKEAMFQSFENAEDSFELGEEDVEEANITGQDLVVGISASGRTPYVLGAMKKAKERGAKLVAVVNNPQSSMAAVADVAIAALVGPEAITGSTRMKAGTAQKMILNLLSTTTMVKLGKVYENLMVDLKPTNDKLRERAVSIICTVCDVQRPIAEGALVASNNKVKTAILMLKRKLGRAQAEDMLSKCKNSLRSALDHGQSVS